MLLAGRGLHNICESHGRSPVLQWNICLIKRLKLRMGQKLDGRQEDIQRVVDNIFCKTATLVVVLYSTVVQRFSFKPWCLSSAQCL